MLKKKLTVIKMDEETPKNFDEFWHGNVKIPPSVSLQAFGKHRTDEIFMLHDAIEDPPFKGQVFQRLPKHMRRRQMSHFDSRLPRSLRSAIFAKSKETPPKRPSRKYRRKPRNLLADYIRRQREKVWLETHIWHAKRFHIEDRWGYRLPTHPTNKTFRANYRASARNCLLLDISYYNCIELLGKEEELLLGLQTCVNSVCGLTFAARYFLDGSREGSTVMFHPGGFPKKVIGQVSFFWKPKDTSGTRCLWLWAHPSFHDEIVDCLKLIFKLSELPSSEGCEIIDETKGRNPLNVPSFSSEKVIMNLLKDTLNRFRLVGPLSSSVLADALRPATHVTQTSVLEVQEIPAKRPRLMDKAKKQSPAVEDCWRWLLDVCSNQEWSDPLMKQEEKFNLLGKVTSPTQFPPHSVLSLLALDPRLSRPVKRTKSLPSSRGEVSVEEWDADLARSLIWNETARDAATNNKPSTMDVDRMLAKRIVPNSCNSGAVLPLLLIQRPGCRGPDCAGFSSGWDVICPSGWGMPLWLGFILRGAKPGGLREMSSVEFESQSMKNQLQPDSKAGRLEAEDLKKKKRLKYLSLPPAKRPNYIKLGIPSPFLPAWSKLAQFWSKEDESGDFYVLRDISYLWRLSKAVEDCEGEIPKPHFNISGAIIAIALSCKSGKPDYLSHLYFPTADDLTTFQENKQPPMEPKHRDMLNKTRKATVQAHRKLLRSERRKRKKSKSLLAEEVNEQPLGMQLPEEFVSRKKVKVEKDTAFQNQMADLWLPSEDDALRVMEAGTRRLMGYVTSGDFGMSEGCGVGLGYILLPALLKLREQFSTPLLILRNKDQTQYRFSTFRVLTD